MSEEEILEIIPILESMSVKFEKEWNKVAEIVGSIYPGRPERRKYLNQLQEIEQKWVDKVQKLGGRVVRKGKKVRFEGKDCFYFWNLGKNELEKVYF